MDEPIAEPQFQKSTKPKAPRVWTVFAAILLAVALLTAFQIIVGIGLAIYEMSNGVSPQQLGARLPQLLTTPLMFMLLISCSQLAFALVAIAAAYASTTPLRKRLGLVAPRQGWSVYPMVMLGSIVPTAIGFGCAYALAHILPGDPTVSEIYSNITPSVAIVFVLFIAIAPGVCEELMFRGYVQVRLLERWGPAVGIGITSLLFALVHIMPLAIVVVIPIGIWLGIVAWRTGSILPGMACHAFINGSVNALRMLIKFGFLSEKSALPIQLVSLVIGGIAFIISCRMLAKGNTQEISVASSDQTPPADAMADSTSLNT